MTASPPDLAQIQADLANTNWGRWGADDERGAPNLITPDHVLGAAATVREGRTISLSRPAPRGLGGADVPGDDFTASVTKPLGGGYVLDRAAAHGSESTHIDALCHLWGDSGTWGGRDPEQVLTPDGTLWADIDQWRDGLVTRCVLFDVPRFRGVPYVEQDRPVLGSELAEIARQKQITLRPGDAIAVCSGREAWSAEHGPLHESERKPGLHASCMRFLREHDVAVLCWDQMDVVPNDYEINYSVHGVLWSYGVALVDNALLEPLADACAEADRSEFMLVIAPLRHQGATGSPVNPIAIL